MNDAFLPGNGFDTYEEQDRVLMGLSGSVRSGVAVRILQQQGFAVAAAVVRLADTSEEHAAVDAARALAKKLDVECVTLNAEALAGQDAEAARFAALLTAADKLGIQYIASGRYAHIETCVSHAPGVRGFCQCISLTFNLLVFILILRMEICEGGAVRQFPEHPGVDPNEKRNGYSG